MQVNTTYLRKPYQLIVNCPQAVILTLFNQYEELSTLEIKNKAELGDKDF